MPKKTKTKKTKKPKKVKKPLHKRPISLAIRIILFLFLIIFSGVTYLSITIAISPRSIPIITTNIESAIKKSIHKEVKIQDTHLSITKALNLKVIANNLEIIDDEQKTITTLPNVHIEVPIFSMLFGNFSPKKLIISNADLTIDYRNHDNSKENGQKQPTNAPTSKILDQTTSFFINLKDNFHQKSLFEIKDTNITLIGNNSSKNLYIKSSQINSYYNFGKLLITFKNEIKINEEQFNLAVKCIVNSKKESNCQIQTKDFSTNSFSWIHQDLKILDNINANFNITARLKYNKYGLDHLEFSANAKNGSFSYEDFFHKKIDFNYIEAKGTYDQKSNNFNLQEIIANFKPIHKNYTKYNISPNLKMSLNMLEDKNIYDISINNILVEELEKFWPSTLAKEGSRKWAINHLESGYIKNADAKFETINGTLTQMNAKLELEDATINYNNRFPKVYNAKANIDFDTKSMKAKISHAKILESKVENALISIDDFADEKARLNIKANLSGNAANTLQHVAYKSKFAQSVKKYFNGYAKSDFELSIPLTKSTEISNISLKLKSNTFNNQNSYLTGNATLNVDKQLSSTNFNVEITTKDSDVNCDILGVHKNKKEDLTLKLTVNAKDLSHIKVQDISITKPSLPNKVSALLEFNTDPFKITKLNITNSEFGDNDYDLKFDLKDKKLTIKGRQLNLSDALKNKAFNGPEDNDTDLDFTSLHIVLNELNLANDNNLIDAYLFYDCTNGLCKDGGIVSLRKKYGQFLKLDIEKEDEKSSKFNAKIFNVGELAESLGISNLVKDGKAQITAINTSKDNKFSLEGEIEVYSDMTIFENESVMLLEKDTLYSTVKDKIFSNKKTTFNKVRIKFELTDKLLTIKSLIANNYKIGITAKGTIDLRNGIYNLEGFILPGYLINNLFGLGEIPIIGSLANLLTNGEGGGLFGIKYYYSKNKSEKDFTFKTNKMSAFVPTSIQDLF